MGDEARMRQIGEVADAVRLSLRITGGSRLYTDADIERLRLVKHMRPLDFSLDELRQILDARDRLEAGVDGPEESALTEQLASSADRADERCVKRRVQNAEAMAAVVNQLGGRRRCRNKTSEEGT